MCLLVWYVYNRNEAKKNFWLVCVFQCGMCSTPKDFKKVFGLVCVFYCGMCSTPKGFKIDFGLVCVFQCGMCATPKGFLKQSFGWYVSFREVCVWYVQYVYGVCSMCLLVRPTQVEFFLPKTNFWRSVSCLCLHHILPPVKVHIMASSRKGNFNSSLQKRYKARWRLGYSSSMQLTPNYHALLWAWRRKLLAVEKKMMKM